MTMSAHQRNTADRFAMAAIGTLCVAGGVAVALWCLDMTSVLDNNLDVLFTLNPERNRWLPALLAVLGLAVVLYAVWSLWRRVQRTSMADIRLQGSSATGRLTLDAKTVANVVAEELNDTMGVSSAKAKPTVMLRRPTYDVKVVVEPTAELSYILPSINDTVANLGTAVGDRAGMRVVMDVQAQRKSRRGLARVL